MSRHPEAIISVAGQESVWDYPRPPRIESVSERIVVRFAGETIADTYRALRIVETSHPPVYYLPPQDMRMDLIVPAAGSSWCEFKGNANYLTILVGTHRSERAAWRYENPTAAYQAIAGYIAFYASRIDEAQLGDERVVAQNGDYYGGWITSRIVGPFKGGGTFGW
ncbi:hypothetical protein A9174_10655 [Mesorhizobium loti NZP2037]|nr:DUF427 domain-containing protein [Mesorhizobium loti]ANN57179.1 hypothetical protein A9174_10655 [Mesorhizobium loti NZP2037]